MKDKDEASAIIVTGLFEVQQLPHLPFHWRMWCGMNKSSFFPEEKSFWKSTWWCSKAPVWWQPGLVSAHYNMMLQCRQKDVMIWHHPRRHFKAFLSAWLQNQEGWKIYQGQVTWELNQLGSTSILGKCLIKLKSHLFSWMGCFWVSNLPGSKMFPQQLANDSNA